MSRRLTYDVELNDWLNKTEDKAILDINKDIQEVRDMGYEYKSNKLRDKILNQLRAVKIKQVAAEISRGAAVDQLEKLRAKIHPMHDLLERLWLLLQEKKVELPIDLTVEYLALREGDPHVKPVSRAAASSDRLEEPTKAGTKQNRSDIPRRTTEARSTAVEETPSIRARTAGYITPIKDITLQFSSERFGRDRTEVKDEERDLPDLPQLHSSSPIALTEEEVDALNKRRRSGEAEYVIKRRKIVQDINVPRSHSPDHIVPDINIKAESDGKNRSVSVKPEK
ncbi:hypothetical protein E8E13_002108 [Curvularia kusanoi]|uniref:Uncharacterized protein n=1 Tax=Curvularia kusanoi TaxID=90978 RepID=A0A9P4T517_CURKU|nr:hypothetical protein E8E13_002108 [Curvularia kusanoi]